MERRKQQRARRLVVRVVSEPAVDAEARMRRVRDISLAAAIRTARNDAPAGEESEEKQTDDR